MQALIAVIAALAGIAAGFFLRNLSAKTEKSLLEAQKNRADQDAASLRVELSAAQSLANSRAGFESLATERQTTIDTLTKERSALKEEVLTQTAAVTNLSALKSKLEADLENEQKRVVERDEWIKNAANELAIKFKAVAGDVLEEKSKTFAASSQKDLGALLDPLKTQIKEFREKVEKAQSDSNTGVTKLETLIGSLNTLNLQLAEEAKNLSTALRGSAKAQGDWGEFILRDLLEKAGLREGEQYRFQQTFTNVGSENGERGKQVRTDVIVTMPGGRSLIIDSKVSLVAYTDCVNATEEAPRNAALKAHIASIRGHISGLANAGYHRLPGIESPDFVVMFIPIEPAFLLALQNDETLWSDAYKQGILLVGPTTLLYVIRIVNVLWQQELQARSVQDVMERGTALYEKFVGFVTDMESIGKSIRSADTNYSSAIKKLSEGPGNLVRQVEMLKKLGIRTTKSLPKNLLDASEADEQAFALAASAEETAAEE